MRTISNAWIGIVLGELQLVGDPAGAKATLEEELLGREIRFPQDRVSVGTQNQPAIGR